MGTKKNKELYDTPSMIVVVVKQKGAICQSALRDGYGTANEGVDPSQLDGGIWNW